MTILDSPNLKEFAYDNLDFDQNGEMFSKRVESAVGKGEIEQYLHFPQIFSKDLYCRYIKARTSMGKG